MKAHRRILLLCVLSCLLLFALSPSAYAHPGRTDEDGGHTDSDTGDYHYHHGYPPHDHYDMDGDGEIDCPYDFDDQTDHSSKDYIGTGSRTDSANPTTPQQNDSDADKTSLWDILLVMLEYLPGSIGIWLFGSYFSFCVVSWFFDANQGCSFSLFIGAIIALLFYIWSVVTKFI